MIYLDFGAATPIDEEVLKEMQRVHKEHFYNPSGVTVASRSTKRILEDSRAHVARIIGAKPSEVVLTAGGTEANNLAVSGLLRHSPGGTAVMSQLEHSSVRTPVNKWGKGLLVDVDEDGRVNPKDIKGKIQDDTSVVAIAYADSELGIIQPIKDIARVIKKVKMERSEQGLNTPLHFHVDASQAAGYLDLSVNRLGVDTMVLNGSKFYGPKQSAALFVRKNVELEPLIYGGGQEHGLRAGTENVAHAAGLALALKKAEDRRKQTVKKLTNLQKIIFQAIEGIAGSTVNGSLKHRMPHNVNASFKGLHAEDLVLHLEQAGFIVGTGAACSVGKDKPSASLTALGLTPKAANQSIRITLSHLLNEEDVRSFTKQLPETIKKVRSLRKKSQ